MTLKNISVCVLIFNLLALSILSQTTKSGCICPVINLTAPPAPIKSGAAAIFTAQINGDKGQTIYNWSVSSGAIIEGQGTPTIKVDTNNLEDTAITATVTIGGWCPTCENTTASASVVVEANVKPVLIDKFERANCEDVLARMDNFMTQLQNDPSATGYIIIYGKPRQIAFVERETRNWIKIRNFDPSRLVFIRGSGTGEKAEIELWLVPPGANPPEPSPQSEPEETAEPEEKVEITKPYIFGSKFADGIEGCNSDYDIELYAETLKANPKSRGNVVIYETSQNNFRKAEKDVLVELKGSGIARKKIKIFYAKVKPNQLREGIELWFLP